MNIALGQLAGMVSHKPVGSQQAAISSRGSLEKSSFGELLNSVVSSPSKPNPSTEQKAPDSIDAEKMEALLASASIDEAADLLGIHLDEGLFMSAAGADGQALAMEEMMGLDEDELLSLLNLEPKNLLETLQQLTGIEINQTNNVRQLIGEVLKQGPTVIQQLLTALQGEHKTTPRQAEQVIQFLKLAQVAEKELDLPHAQTAMLEQLVDTLKNGHLQHKMTSYKDGASVAGRPLHNFQQMIQHAMKSVESSEAKQSVDEAATPASAATPVNLTAKTITIALPAEKGAQSEALAKEMQNLLNRSRISNTPGTTKLLLKLYPEKLGSIRIEIMQQNGVLTAKLLTSTAIGKELLDSQLQQLKTAFAQANIQMDRIEIAQSLQETDRNNREQNPFGQQFKQSSSQGEERDSNPDEEEESNSFSDYLIYEEV